MHLSFPSVPMHEQIVPVKKQTYDTKSHTQQIQTMFQPTVFPEQPFQFSFPQQTIGQGQLMISPQTQALMQQTMPKMMTSIPIQRGKTNQNIIMKPSKQQINIKSQQKMMGQQTPLMMTNIQYQQQPQQQQQTQTKKQNEPRKVKKDRSAIDLICEPQATENLIDFQPYAVFDFKSMPPPGCFDIVKRGSIPSIGFSVQFDIDCK